MVSNFLDTGPVFPFWRRRTVAEADRSALCRSSSIFYPLQHRNGEERGKRRIEKEREKKKKERKKRNVSTRTDTSTPKFSSRFTTKELVYYFDYFLFRCSFNVSSYGIEKVSLRWYNFKMELFKMLLRMFTKIGNLLI